MALGVDSEAAMGRWKAAGVENSHGWMQPYSEHRDQVQREDAKRARQGVEWEASRQAGKAGDDWGTSNESGDRQGGLGGGEM